MNNEKRIKEIEKEFIKLGLIDVIPMIMIGLGLHAKFDKGNKPIFEFLKNETIVNGMFIIAVPIVLWCMIKAIKLASERKRIEANANS
ncbi:hypothetical protein [Gallaecimonas sp. GXIMD1310]|uniref:hypothetical protein n=1 Tax=Gallaecimonas sp. GXIMD1310 TaxID=3131926 RepID=UPI003243946F